MKEIYEKTITTIFIVPILKIDRKDLFENNFINAFLGDINKEDYHEENVVFLLFKPKNLETFRTFLDRQYDSFDLIDDYDYGDYVVLVYLLDKKWEKDYSLIKKGKYSKLSEGYKSLFPLNVINYEKEGNPQQPSLQHLIFKKDSRLINFWEKTLGDESFIISNHDLEAWPGFDELKEVLDIDKL